MGSRSDFSKGSISKNILSLALPMTAAQLVNVLYSVVDRIYLGRLPGSSHLALTGLGVTIPIVSIIMGFANLCGTGGGPIFSICRGQGDQEEAERVMGNSFSLLLILGAACTAFFLAFKRPILYLFGASDATFPYADDYMTIYLMGTLFVMISLGMNPFVNAQGFGSVGMMTVVLGAAVNIVLDPIFIFLLNMGVKGAALATVIGQAISCLTALGGLGAEIPHRAAGAAHPEAAVFPPPGPAGQAHRGPWPVRLLYEHDQQSGADRVQRHPPELWRGPVRGRDDHHQLPAGGVLHACPRSEQRRPAGDGL